MTATIRIRGNVIVRQAQFENGAKAAPGRFRLVARWFLERQVRGEDRVVLPRVRWNGTAFVAEGFDVTLHADKGGIRHFFDPGTDDFTATAPVPIRVEPAQAAQLRPAARPRAITPQGDAAPELVVCAGPGGGTRTSAHGTIAGENEDDNAQERMPLSIRDLLYNAEDSSARGEQLAALEMALATARQALKDKGIGALIEVPDDATRQGAQATLNAMLDEDGAAHIRSLARACLEDDGSFDAVALVRRLVDQRAGLAGMVAAAADPVDGDGLRRLLDLTLLARALSLADYSGRSGVDFLEALQDLSDQRQTAREALATSTAHGGRWLVYDGIPIDRELDSPPGQAFAPELVGLGWISKPMPETPAIPWDQFDAIGLSIDPVPLPQPAFDGQGFAVESEGGRVFVAEDCIPMEPLASAPVIHAKSLRELGTTGTTLPLRQPLEAQLFLGQVEVTPPPPGKGAVRQFTTPTNDTLVRLRLRCEGLKADLPTDRRPGAGFSVYAMGRMPGDNSAGKPTLEQLRPWCINQRYSFLTDLFHAFGLDAGPAKEPDVLRALLAFPPQDPLVPRMELEANNLDIRAALQAGDSSVLEGAEVKLTPYDLASDDKTDLGHKTDTWLSFDLRQASAKIDETEFPGFAGWRSRLGIHWDLNHPVDPALDGAGLQQARGFDRYRFFVTTTDMFGQESEALEVDCAAVFFGNGGPEQLARGDYRPRQRRRIGAPPRIDKDDRTGEGSSQISPLLTFDKGGFAGPARIVVTCETPWRDQVGVAGEASQVPEETDILTAEVRIYRRFLAGLGTVPGAVASRTPDSEVAAVDEENKREGFLFFRADTITQPSAGKTWQLELPLAEADHGYEYRAAIRFVLKDAARAAFFPDEPNRWFHSITGTNAGTGTLVSEQDAEIITAGRFAQTTSASALDPELKPAAPIAADASFAGIRQVGSAGAVSRDVVLAKLLARPVAGQQPTPWPAKMPEWTGARFVLTNAQARVVETTLARAGGTAADPRWHPFLRVLLQEIASVEPAAPEPSGNPAKPPADQAPDPDPIRRHAIIGLRGHVTLQWQAAATANGVPACEYAVFFHRQEPGEEERTTEILTVPAEPGQQDYRVILPVPGGRREKQRWTVVARTSAHATSDPVALFDRQFEPSLMPDPVRDLAVRNSPVPALTAAHRDVLPASLSRLGDGDLATALAMAPRLQVQWRHDPLLSGYHVMFAKQRRKWTREPARLLGAAPKSLAEHLADIAALAPGDAIQPDALKAIGDWLLAQADASLPDGQSAFFFPAGAREIGHGGVLDVNSGQASFVDYFHATNAAAPDAEQGPMELDHEYAYAAAHYLKMDNGRRLISEFTPLTGFTAPRAPDMAVEAGDERLEAIAGRLPRLALQVQLHDPRPVALRNGKLAVHLVAMRVLPGVPVPGAGTTIHRVPLGTPVVLGPLGPIEFRIEAGDLLRSGPRDPVTVDLEIHAGLFLVNGDRREPLGQPKDPLQVTVTIPAPTGPVELELTRVIAVRLAGAPVA